jgi:hypothetical protein
MKRNVSRGKASIPMLVVISILLTVLPLTSYFPSTNSADATFSGRLGDSQTSEDLGKEEQDGRDDSQTSEDLGKEEQDEEESPQIVGQDAPDNGESGEIIEGDPDVDPELLAELRGGDTIKDGGSAEEQPEEESDTLSIEELEAQLRGGDITKQAPISISEDNIYIVWWTNETTGNDEVMLRVSNDSGSTFGDKINLSNTTNTDSVDAKIDSDADSVVVTWWETNQTSDSPVMRVSNDNGATFGPMLALATNGTTGEAEGTEEVE